MIYILHFHQPISTSHTCQHYIGFTDDLDNRIRKHRQGKGSRLCQVAKQRGITFTLAEVLPGDREAEKALKAQKNARRYCPICNQ